MSHALEATLHANHQRLTTARQRIFDVLAASHEPLSIGQIIKEVQEVDRVSVYRTIELFQKLGIVLSIPFGWKSHYELSDLFRPHHHHLRCLECGTLIDIHDESLEQTITTIARDYGFSLTDHNLEMTGYCEKCRAITLGLEQEIAVRISTG